MLLIWTSLKFVSGTELTHNPFPNDKFQALPNLKGLQTISNDRKFSRRVENTVGKGENARYK